MRLSSTALIALAALWALGPLPCRAADLKPEARRALDEAALPAAARAEALGRIEASPEAFEALLGQVLREVSADPMLLYRVDKSRPLPEGYEPSDLQGLEGKGFSLAKAGLKLRPAAAAALREMDRAARAAGVTLLVSSTFRSYAYQEALFARYVKESGLAEAEKASARAGHSQHQLGTAIDFGSITDAFAGTKAGAWLAANAGRFGFSLSYPKGMTAVTGYKWESWHYRYVGKAAARLEAEFFGGVQQYEMQFLGALGGSR